MPLAYLTFFMGLAISAVAIYYSVVGLAAIFAAAVIPIVIMGTTLEVSKLVAAWWLKWNWHRAPKLLKYYLLAAVIVLMFITSMGIFGFLSKAHIDQTLAGSQSAAQVERLDAEIERQNSVIERSESRLRQLETTGTSVDANIQSQIDAEQARIDSAYSRVQPAIDEQQRIIDNQTKLYTDQIDAIDRQLALLQQYIDQNEVAKAQSMIGAKADGRWGPATAEAVRTWQAEQAEKRKELVSTVERLSNNNSTIRAARDEIQRLRRSVETQIADSNALINRLRSQLGQTNANDLEKQIAEERERLSIALEEVERLSAEKFTLETEYRKLEAEVGPIKYIAEFVYGQTADQQLLEKAVTWVIILIIFVFDPLAVLLLIASQVSFRWAIDEQSTKKLEDRQVVESIPAVDEPTDEEIVEVLNEVYSDNLATPADEEQLDRTKELVEDVKINNDEVLLNLELEAAAIDLFEDIDEDENDDPHHVKVAKKSWKQDHPNDSLKHQRKMLELGLIKELPWMLPPYYVEDIDNAEKVSWMENEDGQQIKKEGYVQNQEQSASTLWNRVKNAKGDE